MYPEVKELAFFHFWGSLGRREFREVFRYHSTEIEKKKSFSHTRGPEGQGILVSVATKETPPGHWAYTDLLGWDSPSLPVPNFMGKGDMNRSNFSRRLDKLVVCWSGRAHENVCLCHHSSFHISCSQSLPSSLTWSDCTWLRDFL